MAICSWRGFRAANVLCALLLVSWAGVQLSEAAIHRREAIDPNALDCLRNDNISSTIISYVLSEDAEVGYKIGVLPLKGVAGGPDPTILLTLQPSQDLAYVTLNMSEKTLVLSQQVDPDIPYLQSRLDLDISCKLLSPPEAQFNYRIGINIANTNDNAPEFEDLPYQANISELAQVDSVVFADVHAVDRDGVNAYGQVIYSVEYNPNDPESNTYFAFKNGGRGEIWLLRPLDYEAKRTWEILIQARDNAPQPLSNQTTVTLDILDGEDMPPRFLPCNATADLVCPPVTYYANILEKENITDALIFEPGPIQAEDRDLDVAAQGPITYSLADGYPREYVNYFRIDPSTGEVFLLQPINRADFREFSLEVKASETESEGGMYAIAQVSVTIVEVNEHKPSFDQSSYRGYVYENSPIGTQVSQTEVGMVPLKLHASDMDVDPGRPLMLTYYLSDPTAHFVLESGPDGSFAFVVVSMNALDREVQDHYTIEALAIENDTTQMLASNRTTIEVTVLDVNDNPPKFLPNDRSIGDNRYRATVEENAGTGTVIMTLETEDMDLPPHERVNFIVNYINNQGQAKIGPEQAGPGAVHLVLKENGTIVEGEQYSISLQAVDSGMSSLMSEVVYIEILVLPANVSHTPTFEQRVYEASASEGLPVNAFITTVTAIDRDEDAVYYNITDGNVGGVFTVDSASGEVIVVGTLNREEVASYVLRIQATDGIHRDTCLLRITILDVNDNNPVFNTTLPTDFLVVEGVEDELVGQVQAYDIDEPDTPNSIVRYSLESDSFRIEPDTGLIYTVGALDREDVGRYELAVVATDTAEAPRSQTLLVVVTVQDVNDNSPVFEPSQYSVDVRENRLARDFLTLKALDRDASAVLEYLITAGDTQVFSLAPANGSLSLLTELDYEEAQTHTLQVTVRDTELAAATNSTATVTINVLDENDNEPIFTMDSYQGAVLRTADLGSIAASGILARDGDLSSTPNGEVFYSIMPDSVYFTISDPMVGTVVTKTSLQNAPNVNNLTVVAYDNGDPSRSQTATLIILVKMERPVFPQSVYMVDDLMEGEPAGTKVVELHASSNPGDLIEYHILSGDPSGNFELVSQDNTGVLSTAKVLDREEVSSYSLMVQAVVVETSTAADGGGDGGGRRRRQAASDVNVVEIVIDLVDVNDNVPWFEQSAYFVGVSDSGDGDDPVITMTAYDLDSNNNSQIEYSMVEEGATADGQAAADGFFTIGPSTGEVRTVKRFAAEPRIFTRTVFGREKYGPPENMANASLTISLINEENRIVLVTNVSYQQMKDHEAALEAVLEELLAGEVGLEYTGVRQHGENLQKNDPSGSDTQFHVIDTATGEPFTSDELLKLLSNASYISQVNAVLREISSDGHGEVIDIRKPGTGRRPLTLDSQPTVEAIALLCLAVALFILCILAIAVVIVSWKKREMEREKQARLYLPVYNNTFNPYASKEDHEIANPVYFDEHAVQVLPMSSARTFRSTYMPGSGMHRRQREDDNELLFEDGAPSFMKPRETQEHTMDFDNELSSDVTDEADEAANTIAAAVRSSSRKSSLKSRSKTPSSSGPPSYSSNGQLGRADSHSPSDRIHQVSTIPYRRGGGGHGRSSPETPRQPIRPPPLFDPRPTPTSDPRSPFQSGSFDNYGADLGDEGTPLGSPISGARTDSSLSTHKLDY